MLLAMERSDVYVIKPAAPQLPWEFYRNMLPDVPQQGKNAWLAARYPPHRSSGLTWLLVATNWAKEASPRCVGAKEKLRRRPGACARSPPLVTQVPLVLCHGCNHFFHEEDWELALMQKDACPFCRTSVDPNHGNGCALYVPEDTPAPVAPKRLERVDTLHFD
jgi:hypothetical protein